MTVIAIRKIEGITTATVSLRNHLVELSIRSALTVNNVGAIKKKRGRNGNLLP